MTPEKTLFIPSPSISKGRRRRPRVRQQKNFKHFGKMRSTSFQFVTIFYLTLGAHCRKKKTRKRRTNKFRQSAIFWSNFDNFKPPRCQTTTTKTTKTLANSMKRISSAFASHSIKLLKILFEFHCLSKGTPSGVRSHHLRANFCAWRRKIINFNPIALFLPHGAHLTQCTPERREHY